MASWLYAVARHPAFTLLSATADSVFLESPVQFTEILKRCKGQTVVINNDQERELMDVEDDFLILQGGNPQMRLTEFIPVAAIIKVIRADYATGASSISIDLLLSGGDQKRGGGGHF